MLTTGKSPESSSASFTTVMVKSMLVFSPLSGSVAVSTML